MTAIKYAITVKAISNVRVKKDTYWAWMKNHVSVSKIISFIVLFFFVFFFGGGLGEGGLIKCVVISKQMRTRSFSDTYREQHDRFLKLCFYTAPCVWAKFLKLQ